jgi:uncharacterized membrane protein
MSLAPLLNAPTAVQIHAFLAIAAFLIGLVQLYRTKGTPSHRATGYVWVAIMVVVAASGFWIHEIRLFGPWSPIHLLSIFTLIMLPLGVYRARSHNVRAHKWTMIGIFGGALIIAGIFTFVPGRIMFKVLFGG